MNDILKIIKSDDSSIYTILLYPKYSQYYIDELKKLYDGRTIYVDMFTLQGDTEKRFWSYTGNEYELELITHFGLIYDLKLIYNVYIDEHHEIIENSCHSRYYKSKFLDHLFLFKLNNRLLK